MPGQTEGQKDGRTEGWTDKTLFYRTLPATAGGPTRLFQTLIEELS